MISPLPADGVERLGGREVHVITQPGAARPVVLLGGCGVPSYAWDRSWSCCPRSGWSGWTGPVWSRPPWPGQLPTLAEESATLVELLERLGVPAVLVAHSMAGPHAEAVARTDPELVAGLVLVDSSVEWETPGRVGPRLAAPWPELRPAADGSVRSVVWSAGPPWRSPATRAGADRVADAFAAV